MKEVLVIGAGAMGSGIAQVIAQAGHRVYLKDREPGLVAKGARAIESSLDKQVSKGKLDPREKALVMGRIVPVDAYGEAKGAALVMEAVAEDAGIKKALFSELKGIFAPETIFASNTSALSTTALAGMTDRPDRFLGLHFFNPAPVMKLVEIIKAAQTSEETLEAARSFVGGLGKSGVLVNEAPGFVVNRILIPLVNEAAFVASEGVASPEDIDAAMKDGANHPIGPLALADLIGIDVVLAIMDTLREETGDPKYRACPLLRKMARAGYLGRKTGKGFYSY